MKQKEVFLVLGLILVLLVINYSFLDRTLTGFLDDSDSGFVERVIDGDTIVVRTSEGNGSVRLLGINTPEKGELYSQEAADFMEQEVLNKTVKLVSGKDKYDLYGRRLAFIYLDGENVNLKQVENGFANFYFPSGKTFGYDDFKNAWERCLISKENLCEPSKEVCGSCVKISNLNFKGEVLTLKNSCNVGCNLNDWDIKDEGRKHFSFDFDFNLKSNSKIDVLVSDSEKNNATTLIWSRKDYVWTDSGDTAFLRDSEGRLVDYYNF